MTKEPETAPAAASEFTLNKAYLALARQWSLWEDPFQAAVAHITESVCLSLGARRASIWLLNAAGSALELCDLFDSKRGDHSAGSVLVCTDYPEYFAAMESGRVIAASDAHADYRTREFSASYLTPEGVGAMLDATLRRAGKFSGVLCVEHVGGQRLWNEYEKRYAISIADLVMQRLVFEDTRRSESLYRSLFERAGDSTFLMKEDRFIDCNKATLQMFGCTRQQVLNETPYRYSPDYQPDGRSSREKALEKISAAFRGETQFFEWRHVRHDGTPFDAEVTLNMIEIDGVPHLLATVRDISGRKQAEIELARSRQALLDRNESLRLINELSSRLHASSSINGIVGETMDTLLGMSRTPHVAVYLMDEQRRELQIAGAHGFDAETLRVGASLPLSGSLSGLALSQGSLLASHDIVTDTRLEASVKCRLVDTGFRSAVVIPLIYNSQPLGSLNLLYPDSHDIGTLEIETLEAIGKTVSLSLANAQHMAEMEYLAHHDSLTRLPNRTILHREFDRRIAGRSGQAARAVLMLLDLDRFKEVNDTLGHYVGDALLKQIGPRLESVPVEGNKLLCRLGGDEFTLLLQTNNAPLESALTVYVQQLLDAVRQPFCIDGIKLELDASIGVALYPKHGHDSHALLRSADVAMYEAKRKGCGYVFYDRQLDRHSPQRLAIMSELGAAVREQQLCLHYQPKIDLGGATITGFEALVRWPHPTQGLLYPDKFMPVAEVSDVIHVLSQRVLEMALQQQQLWREQGYNFTMAVNLSARNLVDDRCFRRIEELLGRYDTAPETLELEITETALMHDPDGVGKLMRRIADLGVKLTIDDFGTGYCSLAYLRQLPIDALKIDRLFVSDMLKNEQDAIIVRSTIVLAHNLNLLVVAEGVEDEDTLNNLREMQCDLAQGFYIARPAPSDDVMQWLAGCKDWKSN